MGLIYSFAYLLYFNVKSFCLIRLSLWGSYIHPVHTSCFCFMQSHLVFICMFCPFVLWPLFCLFFFDFDYPFWYLHALLCLTGVTSFQDKIYKIKNPSPLVRLDLCKHLIIIFEIEIRMFVSDFALGRWFSLGTPPRCN